MISLDATVRDNKTKGQLSAIRNGGNVPAIIYGGKEENQGLIELLAFLIASGCILCE